jgi:hypothetical protein
MEDVRTQPSAIRHRPSDIEKRLTADNENLLPVFFSYDPQNLMAKELFSSKYLFVWKKLITFAA